MWLEEKNKLLHDLTEYIRRVSNLSPVPIGFIADLQDIKVLIEIANREEFGDLQIWWETIRNE